MHISLQQELLKTSLDEAVSIPWIIRLLENPESKFSLPGRINSYNHNCLHKILNKSYSPSDKAFVSGFAMGSDPDTRRIHILIFRIFSRFLYPKKYKFTSADLIDFEVGYRYGKCLPEKCLNSWNFSKLGEHTVEQIQQIISVKIFHLQLLEVNICQQKKQRLAQKKKIAHRLRRSSSIFLVVGGCLIALNRDFSGYGFVLTFISSVQLFASAFILEDKSLIEYALAVLIFVDLIGIYFWLLA